jgi:hypothetical protein
LNKKNIRNGNSNIKDELVFKEESSKEDYQELQMHCLLEAELSDSDELLDGIMTELKSSKNKPKLKPSHRLKKAQKSPRLIRWLLPACALLMIGCFVILNYIKQKSGNGLSQEDFITVVGDKTKIVVLKSGASIELKPNSKYRILGDNLMELIIGQLIATAPDKAIGFTVKTSQGKIVDLSTKFDVQTDSQQTKVKVLEGKVELVQTNNEDTLIVYEGETATMLNGEHKLHITSKAPIAEALIISLNFGPISVSAEAGLFKGHWNNNKHLPKTPVHDSLRRPTKMDVFVSQNSSFILKNHPSKQLWSSCLHKKWDGRSPPPRPLEISLKKIPFHKYDIYVYYSLGKEHNKENHVFDLSIGNESYEIHSSNKYGMPNQEKFIRWRGPSPDKSGNYQVFKSLTGDTTIKASLDKLHKGTSHGWYISGIQIVEVKN